MIIPAWSWWSCLSRSPAINRCSHPTLLIVGSKLELWSWREAFWVIWPKAMLFRLLVRYWRVFSLQPKNIEKIQKYFSSHGYVAVFEIFRQALINPSSRWPSAARAELSDHRAQSYGAQKLKSTVFVQMVWNFGAWYNFWARIDLKRSQVKIPMASGCCRTRPENAHTRTRRNFHPNDLKSLGVL